MDMLVKLYNLPRLEPYLSDLASQGIVVRRAMSYERSSVQKWVLNTFNVSWADEVEAAFGHMPIGCHIAVRDRLVCGFCCLDTTYRNFIGPVGVDQRSRGNNVGRCLVLSALHALAVSGYAYAIVGDVGEPGFFKAAAGAEEIPGSSPGAYPAKIGK